MLNVEDFEIRPARKGERNEKKTESLENLQDARWYWCGAFSYTERQTSSPDLADLDYYAGGTLPSDPHVARGMLLMMRADIDKAISNIPTDGAS